MKFLILFISFWISFNSFCSEEIKVLNWWEYISPKVEKDLKKKGFKYSIEEYRSNEVALSKILSTNDKYDIAIISNWALEVISPSGRIDSKSLNGLRKKRKYLKPISVRSGSCVPYLWAVTVFAQKNGLKKISNLNDLASLKNNNKRIGIVDDSMEFFSRWILDENIKSCRTTKTCTDKFKDIKKVISSTDFVSSVEDVLPKMDAVYGWHGEISKYAEKTKDFSFSIPENGAVYGGDFVCILNKKNRTTSELKKIKKFVKRLTNRPNTEANSSHTNYFSPYNSTTKKLLPPKTQRLYLDLSQNMVRGEKAFFISRFDDNQKEFFNTLWKDLRF